MVLLVRVYIAEYLVIESARSAINQPMGIEMSWRVGGRKNDGWNA